ncbi:MAG: SDR family oxidoreductase [Solirubrobacterales bacterium]|nr:SDR family oxidoreductase [Solirubrobacterales bacterium]
MGRYVVVTGGSRGIGREIVARFAALGDDVIAIARDAAALREVAAEHPGSVRGIECDLAEPDRVVALMRGFDEVDVLVNNAGVADSAPLHRTSLECWQRLLAINATAAFLCTREVIVGMRERDRGRIITVASTAGRVGAAYASAYAASKHAAVGLMRSAAAELRGTGVTANAVCPAYADTEMTAASIERIAQRTGRSRDDGAVALASTSPLGRLLAPGEVAAAVTWLASPEASSINGQTLILDGGGIQT